MKSFFDLRESIVKSADKKPETYVGPDGKTKVRMVPVDKHVVNNEENIDEISVKAMADKIANSGSKGLKQTMKANKADELRKTLDAMKARLATNEKTLTPAEKKKREEIAKAMERENPGMDMSKKMAIATVTAKRVAEEIDLDELSSKTLTNYITKASSQAGKTSTPAKTQDKRIAGIAMASKKAMAKEEVELDEVSKDDEQTVHKMLNSHSAENLLKAHKKLYGKEYPGTSKSELVSKIKSKVRNYKHAYELMKEAVELDEVSTEKLRDYASAALQDKDKAKADKRWKYASKAMKTVGDREAKAAHALKYNKMEEFELDEAIMQGSKEHLKKLQGMLDKTKPGSADHSQIRGAIESMFGKQHIPAKHRNVKPDMYQEVKKPDAEDLMHRKRQMAAISASDKDKLAKIRAMLDKEKKR